MDIRERDRIATLPDETQKIARKMLADKFGLTPDVEVVEKVVETPTPFNPIPPPQQPMPAKTSFPSIYPNDLVYYINSKQYNNYGYVGMVNQIDKTVEIIYDSWDGYTHHVDTVAIEKIENNANAASDLQNRLNKLQKIYGISFRIRDTRYGY